MNIIIMSINLMVIQIGMNLGMMLLTMIKMIPNLKFINVLIILFLQNKKNFNNLLIF